MITNFSQGQAIDYQLNFPRDSKEITLRYCGYSNSVCEVLVDGKSINYIDMPRNGSTTEWVEAKVPMVVKAGNHTVTLKLFTGSCYLSGVKIEN